MKASRRLTACRESARTVCIPGNSGEPHQVREVGSRLPRNSKRSARKELTPNDAPRKAFPAKGSSLHLIPCRLDRFIDRAHGVPVLLVVDHRQGERLASTVGLDQGCAFHLEIGHGFTNGVP